MKLSEPGLVAHEEWLRTADLREHLGILLGEFVVMPDHFHGIVIIDGQALKGKAQDDQRRFGPQSANLSSLIRGYKSAVTTYARKHEIPFDWQRRALPHATRPNNKGAVSCASVK